MGSKPRHVAILAWIIVAALAPQRSWANGLFDDQHLVERSKVLAGKARLAEPTKRIIVIGDSLSDSEGRYSAKVGQLFPGQTFYWRGHFSNGPVWNEYVQGALNVPMVSYAIGASRIAEVNHVAGPLRFMDAPSAEDQVTGMIADGIHLLPTDLLMVWIGFNDFLWAPATDSVPHYVEQLEALVTRLAGLGARRIAVGLTPPGAGLPTFREGLSAIIAHGATPAEMDEMIATFDGDLRSRLPALGRAKGVHIALFDLNAVNEKIERTPATLGISNTTEACFHGTSLARLPFPPLPPLILANALSTCDDPESYLYWDAWHPTTKVHCLAAVSILRQLEGQGMVKGQGLAGADRLCLKP